MKEDVKVCVDAKIKIFQEYFDIPESVKPQFEDLTAKIQVLGEKCKDSMDFESRFMEELQEIYNGMFLVVTPKAVQMTEEQKEASRKLSMELQYGTSDEKEVRKKKAEQALKDAADMASTEMEQEVISMKRKAMIESGTFDEYTRATNAIEDAKIAGKLLGGILKKK